MQPMKKKISKVLKSIMRQAMDASKKHEKENDKVFLSNDKSHRGEVFCISTK